MVKLIRLWDLEKGAKIKGVEMKVGSKKIKDGVIVFDHIDGMYSYNTVEHEDGTKVLEQDGSQGIVHLANNAWLKVEGDHYVLASDDEIKKYAKE